MKKIFVFVVICIILVFYYIFVIYKKIGPSNHAKPLKQNIQLRIKADKDIYKKDEQINITLTIKNTSQDKITLQTIPSFKLVSKKLHIWGPVNFGSFVNKLQRFTRGDLGFRVTSSYII